MFKTYFKTAIRNLKRNKSYAIINVSGLAVGIAACLLLFLVIQYETSFDNFHKNKENIYRVITEFHSQDGVGYSDGVCFPAGNAIRLDFPHIKQVASIYRDEGQVTVLDGKTTIKKLEEENFYYTEPEFFDIFNFGFLSGNAKTALKDPNNAVLTQATAEKYFGSWKAALGKSIKFDNRVTYTVTGILKNIPANTDFPFSVIVPHKALEQTHVKGNLNDWVSTYGGASVFVVLPASLPVQQFNEQLKALAKKYKPAEYATDAPYAHPLASMHTDERFGNYNDHTFSLSLVKVLSVIGIFLIGIACVNFVNLATAQAVNRSREVGIRKVMGSNRGQLAMQFLGETFLITLTAVFIAIGLAYIALPFLNDLLRTKMSMNFLLIPSVILFLLGVTLLATLLSGLYPAIILSGFNPITALKSKITSKMVGGISLRRGLVVIQFAIAHILIIGMLVVVKQMDYFRTASMGFDKANIITVRIPGDSTGRSHVDHIRNELLQNPGITDVSFSYSSPSSGSNWNSDFRYNHAAKPTDFSANLKWADPNYFKTYGLKFVAGRPFTQSDTVREYVVNETLLHKLGINNPDDAIGKEINLWDGAKVANIVGVVRDFNVYSLREPVAAVLMSTWVDVYQTLNIKMKPGAEKTVLPLVEKLWTANFPDYVYNYRFLDERIANYYREENQLSQLYKIFAGIAIFISCLGLYGLISFMAVQRTKEVGIRKVLGASAGNIVYLFSREFTLLILIAFAIATPIAWYFMHEWLKDFTYRVPIGAGTFILAIIGSVIVAWITVGYRAVRAALANPVKSLRSE